MRSSSPTAVDRLVGNVEEHRHRHPSGLRHEGQIDEISLFRTIPRDIQDADAFVLNLGGSFEGGSCESISRLARSG